MPSIDRRQNGRWRARWRDPAGAQRSRVFTRKLDAQRFLAEIEAARIAGEYVDPLAGNVTFREYAEQWRERQVWRASTAKSVEQQLRRHVYPVIGDRPLRGILPGDVQRLVSLLAADMAPSTVEVIYGRVASVFGSAVRDRLLKVSPCVGVKRPRKQPTTALQVLTTEQVLGIADAIPERYRAVVVTAAGAGLRPGELFGLCADRIDFLRRTVRVDQQLVRVRGGVELAAPKTAASVRTIPAPRVVLDGLAAHLARWPADPAGVVFTNERGAPIQQHPFAVVFGQAVKKAGAPAWATPHALRHYFASLLIARGGSVKVVQARLGHASARTTLDTYARLWPDDEDATRAAVDAELEPHVSRMWHSA